MSDLPFGSELYGEIHTESPVTEPQAVGYEQARALEQPVSDDVAGTRLHRARRVVEGAVIIAEVTPINEAARVAAGGVAVAAGLDPLYVAGVYGSVTLGIETGAAVAAASWLGTERSKRRFEWFNDKLEKRGISPDAKFSPMAKAGIAFIGGSAISEAVKYREDTSLTEPELRKYGVKTAAALAGTCAVQGYFVAKGIDAPSPWTIGGAVAAVASIGAVFKWGRRRVTREQNEQGFELTDNKEVTEEQ